MVAAEGDHDDLLVPWFTKGSGPGFCGSWSLVHKALKPWHETSCARFIARNEMAIWLRALMVWKTHRKRTKNIALSYPPTAWLQLLFLHLPIGNTGRFL